MKIRLFSDLHLEFSRYEFDHIWTPQLEDKEQTVLLAGDIGKGMGARTFVEELCKNFKHVVMICGNHEFYDHDFEKVIEDWRHYELNEASPNFHFLYNDWRILDGVRFLGGTMWTDFNGANIFNVNAAYTIMSDYSEINYNGGKIRPQLIIAEHDKFMRFLLEKFDEPFDGPTVVMSHHSPGNELKRMGKPGDLLGAAYFADIEEVIGYHNKAKVWVHGHTHQSWDYLINETRVLCNPYGYYGHSTNSGFDKHFTFEV